VSVTTESNKGEGGVMEILLVLFFIILVWGSGYFIGKMIAHKETLQSLDAKDKEGQ
jgi:hypothetical protein